ncbi:hypothetical protein IGI04_007211 [Brassica rapa subsp. trilocularis]|uniref:Uncharacterized protein n=1 Tax=Brassica rapa subsp. trilocularis TaxID=1813537 RepID=A0ABQ7NJ35_BRACM|nr:hypothetical protein IGI04_007211 [Brassica rapa subsp. trilocularis]
MALIQKSPPSHGHQRLDSLPIALRPPLLRPPLLPLGEDTQDLRVMRFNVSPENNCFILKRQSKSLRHLIFPAKSRAGAVQKAR